MRSAPRCLFRGNKVPTEAHRGKNCLSVCRKEGPPRAERVLGKSQLLVLHLAPSTEETKQKQAVTYLPLESELKRKCKNSCPFESIKVTMSHLFASYKFPSFLFSPKVGTVHPCSAWCLTPSEWGFSTPVLQASLTNHVPIPWIQLLPSLEWV